MEEFILSETRTIFNKAIKRFAKENKKDSLDVSFLLNLTPERQVGYMYCQDHAPFRETNIKEILNVRAIDMKGYTVLVPPQIKNIIEKLESEIGSKNIEVCVYLDRDDEDEIRYFVYQDGKYLKEVNLLELIK
jgi:cellobiose-specific phosphotransferase system component IIB